MSDTEPGGTSKPSPFLYLTTIGWRSGRPHRIEIWYVALDGRYYLCSELWDRAHWVGNLRRDPRVLIEVEGLRRNGLARAIDEAAEPELVARVKAAFDAKYRWSDGLLVELRPAGPG
jgi:deazaflavin-dependent oxidoreductase (nitroreductase family)